MAYPMWNWAAKRGKVPDMPHTPDAPEYAHKPALPGSELLPQAEISCLLQALTLRALHGLEDGGVEARLARIEQAIVRAHRAEMAKLDEGTTVIGQQIEELAAGMTDAEQKEQAAKLHALAAKLKAMGHEPTNP